MANVFERKKRSVVDEEIDRVHSKMLEVEMISEDYIALLAALDRLIKLKSEERSNRVSPDTLAIVGGNLAGILIVVGYEYGHVIASRGMNMLLRTKHG